MSARDLPASELDAPGSLAQLVATYPDFLIDALAAYLERSRPDGAPETWLDTVDVSVSLEAGEARVELADMPVVADAVRTRLVGRAGGAQ